MKFNLLIFAIILFTIKSYGQKIDYNQQDGLIAEGYDVVAYFSNKAAKGNKNFVFEYDGVKFRFSTEVNLKLFKRDPVKYIPQYGGWCAYAVGANNKKVTIDPETFEIRNGKLYLFYNAFFNNTLNNWLEEGPAELILKADNNWIQLKVKE